MGEEKAQQITVCLCIHTCISSKHYNVDREEKQTGRSRRGRFVDDASSVSALCCAYNTSGRNCVVLAFVWSSLFITMITASIFKWRASVISCDPEMGKSLSFYLGEEQDYQHNVPLQTR